MKLISRWLTFTFFGTIVAAVLMAYSSGLR